MKLVSQVNGDGDIIESWIRHYLAIGIQEFLIILHGPASDNQILLALVERYPIAIVDRFEATFDAAEKCRRQALVLERLRGNWVMLVDSDEFVELPYDTVGETVSVMQWLKVRALAAPMLQRTTLSGAVELPEVIDDASTAFPLCVPDLYARLGSDADERKYPLFRYDADAKVHVGNHMPPMPLHRVAPPLKGVTHHYKWRPSVHARMAERIAINHPWKHQSEAYMAYLARHEWRLPVESGFQYSRAALFQRDLLRKPTTRSTIQYFMSALAAKMKVGT